MIFFWGGCFLKFFSIFFGGGYFFIIFLFFLNFFFDFFFVLTFFFDFFETHNVIYIMLQKLSADVEENRPTTSWK